MPPSGDRSDLRALARVILDQEEREQASMHARPPRYELEPVRRRCAEGVRLGFVLGLSLGLTSTGAGTGATFRPGAWLAVFLLFLAAGTALGAVVGVAAGAVVRWSQRRGLDAELEHLTRDAWS
ncbi:MAG TPA: hypothetical protein VEP49_00365 [Acidimicrobiia bacterium]|nr:hypothetical protein [Acidimicrobiia bacterium]